MRSSKHKSTFSYEKKIEKKCCSINSQVNIKIYQGTFQFSNNHKKKKNK